MAQAAARPATWADTQQALLRLERLQLFFVGGAPRSGTTWLQSVLDSHPDVSCRGEALFQKHLAEPLDALIDARRAAIAAKSATIFRHNGGYAVPAAEDAEVLLGTGILLALARQTGGKACRAVGEKTPENVFLFARLKHLFPGAKFIGIARDPRDVLASAWHFFHQPAPGENEEAAKLAFIAGAVPSLDLGARTMLSLLERFPEDCTCVTYEAMRAAPAETAGRLFRFLGVTDSNAVVEDCVARTSFAAQSAGRAPGGSQGRSFFRKGTVGDWRATFTPDMSERIVRPLRWMFPRFGWSA